MGLFNIFSQSPLTLRELINIDQGRKDRSAGLSVNLEEVYHLVRRESLWDRIKSIFRRSKTQINMYYSVLKFSVNSYSGNSYTVLIEFQPNPDLRVIMNSKVKVYCSCPSFKFQSAYLLNKKGNLYKSSKTDTLLGQALTESPDPKKTHTSTICKHTFACILWMNDNIEQLMKMM